MSKIVVTGPMLRDMVCVAAAFLEKNKKAIDALNVFPVPDGDTGINMSLTLQTAAKEVREAKCETVAQVADAMALGSLKGARGNSGVILSQICRGFAKGLSGKTEMDGRALADAIQAGSDAAYKAVMKPKEGTILTVVRMMAKAARQAADQNKDVLEVLDAILAQGELTLQQTPELLPVLKEAGVVDSGGTGLLVIFKGFKMSLDGEEVPEEEIKDLGGFVAPQPEEEINQDIEFGYCNECFIKSADASLTEKDAQRLRGMLEKIGDCVLVVGGGPMLKVHVHSNEPGKVLQYCQRFGMLSGIKVDNMREQHRNTLDEDVPDNTNTQEAKKVEPTKEIGIVVVAAGDGISEIFRELGVDRVIEGGQSMNPSIEDIAQAVVDVGAKTVFVYPNNKNIILAAEQAAQVMEDIRVIVIPSRSIPQGITSVIAFDPDASVEENEAAMNEALPTVQSCLVTYAVRDTTLNGNVIKQGDVLGMINGDLVLSGPSQEDVSLALLQQTVTDEHETISIFYGQEVTKEKADALCQQVEASFPDCDVQMYAGGQPLYYYIFGVE